jgi:hypothetical protein
MKVKFKEGRKPISFDDFIYDVEPIEVHGELFCKIVDNNGEFWSFALVDNFDLANDVIAEKKDWKYDFVTAKAPNAAAAQSFLQQQLREVLPKMFVDFEVLSFFSWLEIEQTTAAGILKGAQPAPVFCLCAGLKVVRHDAETEKKIFEEMQQQTNGKLTKV